MNIESTEVKISLTIREAQSLVVVLQAVKQCILNNKSLRTFTVPRGVLEDSFDLEHELTNLLHTDHLNLK